MNLHALRLSIEFRGRPILTVGFIIFCAAAAYEFAGFVISGDSRNLALIAIAAIIGVMVIAILIDWRRGLLAFLTWLLFEDFARKYLGNNMMIFFLKDVLVAVVYLSFFLAYRRREVQTFRPPFRIPLLLMIWFGVMQVFNPGASTMLYGLLGVKLYFYYVPLLVVGYALLNSELQLRQFFKFNLILILVIVSLGIAQAILGHTFLNPQQMADDIRTLGNLYRVSPISGAVSYRPTSVFVSAGRFADFLAVAWLFVLGFTGYLLLRHRRGRSLAFVVVAVTAAGAVMSASRGVFAWSIINGAMTAAASVWGAPWRQRETVRVVRTIQRVALGVAVAIVFLVLVFPDALASRLSLYTETLSPDSSASELSYRAWDYPVQNFLGAFNYDRWPYGYGIGTSALGTQYVTRIFHASPTGAGVESGYGTIVIEMGIVGLLLWIVMTTSIVLSAWRVVRKLKGSACTR